MNDIREAIVKLDFEQRKEVDELEEYVMVNESHIQEICFAVVALRYYCCLLESGLSVYEARGTVWGEEK